MDIHSNFTCISLKPEKAQISTRWIYTPIEYNGTLSTKKEWAVDICNMNLKIIMLGERSPTKRTNTVWIHLYTTRENANLTATKIHGSWEISGMDGWESWEHFGFDLYNYLDVVTVSQIYIDLLNCILYIVCQLYLKLFKKVY